MDSEELRRYHQSFKKASFLLKTVELSAGSAFVDVCVCPLPVDYSLMSVVSIVSDLK